jgi:hypothetical protein
MININNILNTAVSVDPWAHRVIDNIFSKESFEIINAAASHLSYLSVIDRTVPVHIDEAIRYGISKDAENIILDSADMLLRHLEQIIGSHCLNGRLNGSYFIMPKFGITGRQFQYPIHDESVYKVLNLVCYLQPENSVGTKLYSGPADNLLAKQIEWEPNRAALFYPGKDITWHNWTGQQSDQPRITLNFFVERMEALQNTLYKPGDDTDSLQSLLWFYEKIGHGRLHINIG